MCNVSVCIHAWKLKYLEHNNFKKDMVYEHVCMHMRVCVSHLVDDVEVDRICPLTAECCRYSAPDWCGMETSSQLAVHDGGMSPTQIGHMMLLVDHLTWGVGHMTPRPLHPLALWSVLFSLLPSVYLSLSPPQPHTHHTVHINNHQGNPMR